MLRLVLCSLVLLAPAPLALAQDAEKAQTVEGKLTIDDPEDQVHPKKRFKLHTFKMEAGKTYTIDMEGTGFDAYLRLETPEGKQVAFNDDRGDGTLHSRIIYKATKDGEYRVIATALDDRTGSYTLSVRLATPGTLAFSSLQGEFQKTMQSVNMSYMKAKTQDEKDQVLSGYFEQMAAMIDRFAKIAVDYPTDPAAQQASQMVRQQIQMLGSSDSPKVSATLAALADKGGNDQLRLQAALSLGQNLRARSEKAYNAKDKQKAEQLHKEAEAVLTAAQKKFTILDTFIAEQLKDSLFELQNLAIGKVAPDIDGEDIGGMKFKLSDYRGKVVVLDFWGHW